MNKAQEIKEQIYTYYGDSIYYVSMQDLGNSLINNRIESSISTKHKHHGFEELDYLRVLYYEDGSILVITNVDIIPSEA